MTDTIKSAVRRSAEIVTEANHAVQLLEGNDGSRINALGVLADPPAIVRRCDQRAKQSTGR